LSDCHGRQRAGNVLGQPPCPTIDRTARVRKRAYGTIVDGRGSADDNFGSGSCFPLSSAAAFAHKQGLERVPEIF